MESLLLAGFFLIDTIARSLESGAGLSAMFRYDEKFGIAYRVRMMSALKRRKNFSSLSEPI
jgi:hypothetical protein